MPTTQLDASIGAAKESTYGTAVTVTKFVEFTSESLDWEPTFVQGSGLRVGSRVLRSARRPTTPARQLVTGDITCEVVNKGLGWMFEAAFGTVVSTQRAAEGVYQHNFTLSTSDYLPSYTIQKGIPPLGGGTTLPHTFSGCMCTSLTINVPNSDIPTFTTTWNGRDVATATAYAAPSYPATTEILSFAGASITLGGSPTAPTTTAVATGGTAITDVRDFTITIDNALDDGGFNMGSAGKRARKQAVGLTPITGSFTAEFDAATLRDYYIGQNDLPLVVTILGNTTIGSGSSKGTLSLYVPNIRLEGELPKVGSTSGEVITQSVSFTAFDNLSAAPITLSYVSTDVTP
jgi:hypothetical protein